MNNGWIKLHRQLLDNPIVMKDSESFFIWMWLLLNATHSEVEGYFGGKRITLKPGQLITGRRKMASILSCSESKIQRVLSCYENEQQIEQVTDMKSRLITIKNWSQYQESEQVNEQQMNNKRTTGEQLVNTEQEGNNEKNERMKENIITSSNEEDDKVIEAKVVNKEYGNEDVNIVLDLIKEVTGRPLIVGKMTRIHAHTFAKQLKKEYPNYELRDLVRRILEAAMALQDKWHMPKCHDTYHLLKNWQEIVALTKDKTSKSAGANAF